MRIVHGIVDCERMLSYFCVVLIVNEVCICMCVIIITSAYIYIHKWEENIPRVCLSPFADYQQSEDGLKG